MTDVGRLIPNRRPLHGPGNKDGAALKRHDEHLVGEIALIIQPSEVADILRTRNEAALQSTVVDCLANRFQSSGVFRGGKESVVGRHVGA